jgi:hypothetical protein
MSVTNTGVWFFHHFPARPKKSESTIFDPIFSPLAGEVIVHFVQNPDVCGGKNRGFLGCQGEIHFVQNGGGKQALGFWLWEDRPVAEGKMGKDGG